VGISALAWYRIDEEISRKRWYRTRFGIEDGQTTGLVWHHIRSTFGGH